MQVIGKCSEILRINNLFTIFYLELLASKVIVGDDALFASNGEDGMTRERLPFPPVGHGSHAAAAGTNVRPANRKPTMERKACQIYDAGFAARGFRWPLPKNLRHGIASRRGHVAPALLLC
jgi:hypothetical protein